MDIFWNHTFHMYFACKDAILHAFYAHVSAAILRPVLYILTQVFTNLYIKLVFYHNSFLFV